jgi:hypothetical protein
MEDKKYNIFKNFISNEECEILSSWILENFETTNFKDSIHPGTKRKSTRLNKSVEYPINAFEIRERINLEIIKSINPKQLNYVPKFPSGMYASYGYEDDICLTHKDPIYIPNTTTYHFNIILSDYEDGKLIIENEILDLEKKDGILYPVSSMLHSTTKLTGEKPRLFWCFGYCLELK